MQGQNSQPRGAKCRGTASWLGSRVDDDSTGEGYDQISLQISVKIRNCEVCQTGEHEQME